MVKFSRGLLLFAAAAVGLASCSDDSPWSGSDSEGGINLNLSSDSRVMRQTRADDSLSPVVPDGSQFAVNLVKSDNSYSKSWNSVEAFNRESAFPIGDYTLSASFGDLETEGFDNPYYTGVADVHVSPGATTDADIVATLANAMVSIRYTEDFKSNFQAYSAAVQSEGHDWVVFAQTEDRPAYIAPSEIKLNLTLTNESGERVTIQPAGFTALPRHHYVVTCGVTGNTASGNLALDVQFDDDVVFESVNVSLGDDLFSAPAPSVSPKGFAADTQVSSFESETPQTPVEFHVFAFGGIKEATLSVVTDGYEPRFGRRVQLVNADDLTQKQLADEGVDCAGLFRNVDKMAVVNVSKFLSSLPSGKYTVELQVVDLMTRASEPVKLSAEVKPIEIALSAPVAAAFLSEEISVDLSSNFEGVSSNVKFRVPDANNRMVDAVVKSVSKVSGASGARTRSDLPFTYRFVLAIEKQMRESVDVEATVGSHNASVAVSVDVPDFTVTPDAFARKVVLKIEGETPDETNAVVANATYFNGSEMIPSSRVSHDASGLVTISGLSPATTYSSMSLHLGSIAREIPAFTTEAESDVNNGGFSSLSSAVTFNNVYAGGHYKVGAITYKPFYNISYQQPEGWATVNENTCWSGTDPKNTWFMVPSTFAQSGAVVLRSVGYNHAGTVPATTGSFWSTTYYNPDAPAESDFNKAAGELFLGSYSFNGSESRVDGIAWQTRPASVSFDYKYEPVNNENGEMYLKILDAEGGVIMEKTVLLAAKSASSTHTVKLAGYPFGRKAAKVMLGFKSTKSGVTPSINIPSGSALNQGTGLGTGNNQEVSNLKAVAVGSVLTVDNVRFGYDESVTATSKPARKH